MADHTSGHHANEAQFALWLQMKLFMPGLYVVNSTCTVLCGMIFQLANTVLTKEKYLQLITLPLNLIILFSGNHHLGPVL